jgi:hypothetical protein
MDSQAQVILALAQQNAQLTAEIAHLKAELAKYQCESVMPLVPEVKEGRKAFIAVKKVPEVPTKPKHNSHIATGHRVAAINAIRKEFLANAQLNGEW